MTKKTSTHKPRYAQEDFATFYKEKCIAGKSNDACFEAYHGKGIASERHPLRNKIKFKSCTNCKSGNVLVIFAEYSIARHSGNERWCYEIVCNECGEFTNKSFSEQ